MTPSLPSLATRPSINLYLPFFITWQKCLLSDSIILSSRCTKMSVITWSASDLGVDELTGGIRESIRISLLVISSCYTRSLGTISQK